MLTLILINSFQGFLENDYINTSVYQCSPEILNNKIAVLIEHAFSV